MVPVMHWVITNGGLGTPLVKVRNSAIWSITSEITGQFNCFVIAHVEFS